MSKFKIFLLFIATLLLLAAFSYGYSYLFPLNPNEYNEVEIAFHPSTIFLNIIFTLFMVAGILIGVKQIRSIISTKYNRNQKINVQEVEGSKIKTGSSLFSAILLKVFCIVLFYFVVAR